MPSDEMMDFKALEERIAATIAEVQRTSTINVPGHPPFKLQHHVAPSEGELLRDLVAQCGAKRTLEIGMGTGLSGLYICWGLIRAHMKNPAAANAAGGTPIKHTAIDPFQAGDFWQSRGLALRDHAGATPLFDWIGQPDDLALPKLLEQGTQLDFALIDGDHRFEAAMIDFYYIDKMLRVGGICAIDDTDWPSVWRVAQFAMLHRDYQWVQGVPIDLGPITRPWGWKLRASRLRTYARQGWSRWEALRRKPYQFVALRKTREQPKAEEFWANLEGRGRRKA